MIEDSWEIQMFTETNMSPKTLKYLTGTKEQAYEDFVLALKLYRGRAIRLVKVVADYTVMEEKEKC